MGGKRGRKPGVVPDSAAARASREEPPQRKQGWIDALPRLGGEIQGTRSVSPRQRLADWRRRSSRTLMVGEGGGGRVGGGIGFLEVHALDEAVGDGVDVPYLAVEEDVA